MLRGGRGRRHDRERSLILCHELDRARQAGKWYGARTWTPKVPTNLAMPVSVLIDKSELKPRHYTPSQLFGVGFSLGSASKARSSERMSHILRASILTGAGILPSATISSNFAAEIPMYIAASSRDKPRRGSGRISERGRVICLFGSWVMGHWKSSRLSPTGPSAGL